MGNSHEATTEHLMYWCQSWFMPPQWLQHMSLWRTSQLPELT